MNKKGFTLIELLTVIAMIALILLIAVPNMVGVSDNVKREQMLNDAKKLISIAKMKVNIDYELRNFISDKCTSTACTMPLSFLNETGDIGNDPDGGNYSTSSYVKYYKSGNNIKYCIYLVSSKRFLSNQTTSNPSATCVDESDLNSNNKVKTS